MTKKQKKLLGILIPVSTCCFTGIGFGIYMLCEHSRTLSAHKTSIRIDIRSSTNQTNFLKHKGDTITYYANVTNRVGNTIWDCSSPMHGICLDYDNSSEHRSDFLVIRATQNLNSTQTITVRAINNLTYSDIQVIRLFSFEPELIPVNDQFYSFTNGQIIGFSSQVIATPSILANYNTIDLSNQEIAADASFNRDVFNQWSCLKISFAGAKFHFKHIANIDYSGYELFDSCNLSSLIQLDLSHTDFATCLSTDPQHYIGDVYTAYKTFGNTNLSGLSSLNLSNSLFAVGSMAVNGGDVYTAHSTFSYADLSGLDQIQLSDNVFAVAASTTNGGVHTAYNTFSHADLSSLKTLDLSTNKFVVSEMTNGSVCTADATFAFVNFSNLNSLDLSTLEFAAHEMSRGGGLVQTANETFCSAVLPNLNSLNLSDVVFAIGSMTISGGVYTANKTFYAATLSKLNSLDLSSVVFSRDNMTMTGTFLDTANSTFARAKLDNLAFLFLPSNQINQTWTSSFEDTIYPPALNPETAIVHWPGAGDGTIRPDNWTSEWFFDWTWVSS